MKRNVSAGRVLDVLIAQGGALIKRADLAKAAGLTFDQMSAGVEYLRDALAEVETVTFVSARGPYGGVAITTDHDKGRDYLKRHTNMLMVMLRRALTGSAKAMVANATPSTILDAQAIELGMVRLIEDLERMEARL